MSKTFGWLDVRRIGEALADAHPARDPLAVRFTELRRMIEALPGFTPDPAHPVNEKILEAVQAIWHEEAADLRGDPDDDD